MDFSVKLHQGFKILAREQPAAPALITEDSVLTYAELDAITDVLALDLLGRGLKTHEAIGVFTARSAELPVAFLAILKAGGVYVPMVADHPADRLVNMAQQASLRWLIVLDGLEPPAVLINFLKSNGAFDPFQAIIRPELVLANSQGGGNLPDQKNEMTDLAAILFTSGSTGTPKGVMIQHGACVNMALGHIDAHGITNDDRILLSTSPGFILGFRELCLPFLSGAAFVPVSRSVIDAPDRLLALMAQHRVSVAMFTPSYLRLLNGNVPQGLRCIVTAGERPNIDDARHYAQHLDYWNVHGATEVCGTICMYRVDSAGEGPIPSGQPFANTTVYLLDENGNEVANGDIGEIHVVGVGVSPGYLNQPQLTAESFIATRYGRAFRTHDLGRWNINGDLQTLGRADDIVKISGQSVALGEIERALLHYPGVRRASAMQIRGRLVACVESPDFDQKHSIDWREYLGNALPSYMIPAQVVVLPRMPINSAGKVDRKALLEVVDSFFEGARTTEGGEAPQGPLEQLIATIWEDVIGFHPIFREDNFFALGGTSLMVIDVSQRLQVSGHNVSVQMILASLTIVELARRITAQEEQSTINSTALLDTATTDQESFWIASEIGLAPAASHIVRVLSVRGTCPQSEVWQAAWTRLINHHPALRTSFYLDEKRSLCWRAFESHELLGWHNRLSIDRCTSINKAQEIVTYWANERFELTKPPLVRAGLIEVDEGKETLFWFVLHHSVVDGISAQLILIDLLALLGKQPLPPPLNGIALASYAEQEYLVSPRALADREFWQNRLDALVSNDSSAFDEYVSEHSRPAIPSGLGAPPLTEQLDSETVEALGRLAKAHGTGLHALLLAILAAEVQRRNGRENVIIGSGISIRPAGGESAIGHFVSILPVIIEGEGNIPFSTFLRTVQSSLTETVDHGAYPGSLLYREFHQRHPELRTHSRTSLFDIALTAIPSRTCVDQRTGLILTPRLLPGELYHPAAGVDFSFSHEPCPENGRMNLLLTWNPDVCSEDTASAWLASFAAWARWLGEGLGRLEQPLPALLPHETAVLGKWEWGAIQPRPNQRSHEIFEALADKQPNHPAVIGKKYIETFAQLDARANGIAHHLIHQGVARGTTVAVLIEDPAVLPATVLGIWKASGIYLPLAHELPLARLAAIIKDAGASVLIVLDGLSAPQVLIEQVRSVVRIEECTFSAQRPTTEGSPDDVAFIVYTSGTTGMPKGVPLAHKGYVNTILGVSETVGLLPEDRMALVATVGFDASLWELGHGLLTGLSLVPVSHELRDDPWLLKSYYRDLGVTVAFHTPSYLRVSEQVPFEGLRVLFTGGEAPNHRDAQFHADQLAFWNFYGPTEATIVVLGGRVLVDHDVETPLSVGRPLPNVRVSLRRDNGSSVPLGQQGELWLAGLGITSGYLNRPALNAERFADTPEGRFYRSGDYGRWTTDGQIEICGRIDHQIKLNGQRVELGEIEETLHLHPAIAAAVVLVDIVANSTKVLRAFIRAKEALLSIETLTIFLSARLPTHMLPATITLVDTIPLTTVGKVDRQMLLSDYAKQQAGLLVNDTCRNPLEMQVAEIWADILGIPVKHNDNFFALGGNSLLAVTLAHRVSEYLKKQVSTRTLFAAPTLAEFVDKIIILPDLEKSSDFICEADLATIGEREFWTAETAGLDTRSFIIPIQYLINGDVGFDRWQGAWSTLVDRHEGLRSYFAEDQDGQLRRHVMPTFEATMEWAVAADKPAALTHIRQRQAVALSMGVGPLWRVGLVEVQKDGGYFFWLALHHSIGDGQSIDTLSTEMAILLGDGELPLLTDSGKTFAFREQSYLASIDSIGAAEYWRNLMKVVPVNAFDEWPLDRPRSSKTSTGNHRFTITFDPQTTTALKAVAQSYESSFHSLILCLAAYEVRRRTGRTDVLIGTTASTRETLSDAQIVGYGVNMLPLHLKPAACKCFGELLRTTHHNLAEGLQHARYPFARIYRSFWSDRPELRHPQRYPLFDIAVTENPGKSNTPCSICFKRVGTTTKSLGYEYTEVSPGLDIILLHEMLGSGEFLLQLQVNAALYTEETARSWLTALDGWARWLVEEPGRLEQPLPHLLPYEIALLEQWERGPIHPRQNQRSHEIFEGLVDQQPNRPAVIEREYVETFAHLDTRANGIAHHLIHHGVVRGTTVAVLTIGSADLPATVLGIWKAGAIYLPLAQELPASRLTLIAEDAEAPVLIVLDRLNVPESLARVVRILIQFEDCIPSAHRPDVEGSPEDIACILYTSGTTGVPKGVPLTHAGYTNTLLGVAETVGLLPDDRMSLVATVGFDASLFELGHGLLKGIALVPVSNELRDNPWLMKRYYQEFGVTIAFHTPSYLRVGEEVPFEGLRILYTGGEAPNHQDAQHYAGQQEFWNFYGPTEATITVLGGRILVDPVPGTPLSVGRPLPNVRVSLRRSDGSPVPPGQPGELWLGGVGITSGYLNRPELNDELFISTPEGRLYRSGDYGRWTRDGEIEICGRIDDQIKLNGQRIDLGEIEETLGKHPTIAAAVVLADTTANGTKVIRAFIHPRDLVPSTETLTDFLSEQLPVYMLPASITPVAAIPLTPAGKVDREALFDKAKQHLKTLIREVPQNQLERLVATIWEDVLAVPVARNDNFFALGGNSLLAVTLAHRVSENLEQQISARTLFAAPTLATFVGAIKSQTAAAEQADLPPIIDIATDGEREFWTAEKAGLDTRTFTIPVQYRINGDVAFDRLQDAWSTLVDRHEGLRTTFTEDETGQLRRSIAPAIAVTMESAVMADEQRALRHIRERQADSLQMDVAPLWRIGLVEAQKDSVHFIWLALHHAIGDGQSIGTLFGELTILLGEGVLSLPCDHASLFAAREQKYFASTDSKEDAEYWDNLLEQVPVTAFNEWPVDLARSAKTQTGNHRLAIALDPPTFAALKALARSYESSFHSLMLTLLALEVKRRTGRADVVIGTTASIRESIADLQIVGYGVNMLPLHLKPAAGETFGDLLRTTQHSLALTLQYARYPFARIYRSFWSKHPELRHPQRYPLFDIAVTENPNSGNIAAPQRFSRAVTESGSVSYERTEASPGQDIVLIHEGLANGELLMLLQLNAAVYSEETARNWFESLIGWARWLAADPGRATQTLPFLLPEEELLLSKWEHGENIQRPDMCFHELFEMVADRLGQGDRPAIITDESSISYRDLEEEANSVAHALLQRGVGCNSIVAVLSGRSAHLPAAALAVWKSGATYLPLAFDLPPERLAFIARDAGVSQLIVLDGVGVPSSLANELPDPIRPEELSEAFRREHIGRTGISGKPSDVAYILYTSGSTGAPKGTLISHASYVNLVLGATEAYGLTPDDRCLMFASPSFDVSLSDIGVPLACGAAICPVSLAIIESPEKFLGFLFDLGITVADITPTYLRLFEACELPSSLRILVTGGESPFPVDVATYATQLSYFNAYGPTENTITSTLGILKGDEPEILTAGRPLPNTSVHICDHRGQPLPPTVIGEIWLGGCGLSQGYLNRPELTATHFQNTPWGRRYRSGDLGRWSTTGKLEIFGRIDDQVKLSGIRMELGEIEHALTSHAAISQAVALLVEQDNGTKSLWAFVRTVAREHTPREDEWRAYLSERLPSHMIPSGVVSLATIPLSKSGKVDRSALLALIVDRPITSRLNLPQDDLERSVGEVWEAVLGKSPIHREDNFFALGGHSLLAIVVAQRLEKSLGREVPARELFAEPTLSGFAERLRSAEPVQLFADVSTNLATEGQREFWTAEKAGLDTCGFNMSLTLAVQGEVPPAEQWYAVWNTLISRHGALRTGFAEDASGVLRRVIVEQLDSSFNIQRVPFLSEAQAGMKSQQLKPFAMAIPGLWRAGLMQIEESGQTIFWLVIHHSVGDGISLGIIVKELTTLLNGNPLAPLTFSFSQSAARENVYLESDTSLADASYWQQLIGNFVEHFPHSMDEWSLDKPRPHVRTATTSQGGHCFRFRLEPSTAEGLRSLAQRNGASLHAFMLAFLGLEVRRRTGRSHFLLGTAASTRQSVAESKTFGYFVNMLPLICSVEETASIDSVVCRMQKELAITLQHCRYPFARIYDDFRREHHPKMRQARYPLFDIAVTENPAISIDSETDLYFTGMGARQHGVSYDLQRNAPAQDLVLIHEGQSDGGLILTWFANAAIYTKDTAQAWFDSLIGWAQYLADNLPEKNELLPSLLPVEKKLLAQWQRGPHRPLPGTSFPDVFHRLAEKHPERPAVITDAGARSYQEVNTYADRLAQVLLSLDLKRGEAVAVFTERSASLPENVLGLWKAGGCYLPLTADLPSERLTFMAKDAGVRILIVLDGLDLLAEFATDNYTVIRPEELPEFVITQPTPITPLSHDDRAYIIYTSGSTGTPKGVVLRHGGMLNLGISGAKILGIGPDDRSLLMASPSFDLWISDLVMTWSVGGALVPVRREVINDIAAMHALLKRHGVTVATMSPSYLSLFERVELAGLRTLMTVGEPPRLNDLQHYASRIAYFNGYGPTENTAAATLGRLRVDQEVCVAGRPLANTEIFINDDSGHPVPPGVVGEIWLGGMGLAVGYLNRPELTATNFVETKYGRCYRTGDLGRWLRSGELQVLGRADDQVKLRGQRVELGEIEHRLAAYAGVQQAVVALENLADQSQKLRAFVTLKPQNLAPSPAEWSCYLSKHLPSYMIPSAISQVSAIPLTLAGKIDRQALLNGALTMSNSDMLTGVSEMEVHQVRTPAQTVIEIRVSEIWSEQLGNALVMREDDFFELGGDSLKAIAVISRLNREFQCQVNDLYEYPRLADFAESCRAYSTKILESEENNLIDDVVGKQGAQREGEDKAEKALRPQRALYEEKIRTSLLFDCGSRNTYQHVVLTGATGYLGSYLLYELLTNTSTEVTALVRGSDDLFARARLEQVLIHYFGAEIGRELCAHPRLKVLASDLRHTHLLLSQQSYGHLVETVDCIYHCAANVNHIGHYRDFYADNVAATHNLLSLARHQKPSSVDFHFVSTISVSGRPSLDEATLFTEYDLAPEMSESNYYIRTKQEAEHLVVAARGELGNTCIYRVGNIGFATDSAALQQNLDKNAFFRQLAAFLRLGAVPEEMFASLCHVDIVARAIVALSGTQALINEIHHIETSRQDRLVDFIRSADVIAAESISACNFNDFLRRLREAIDQPDLESAAAETMEAFGLHADRPISAQSNGFTVTSERTQRMLEKIGITWPAIPSVGQNALLRAAMKMYHL